MVIQKDSTVRRELGVESNRKFSILDNDIVKIFRLLSSSTYVNSEASIVREISANAYDAMAEVGKETSPIYIEHDKINDRIIFRDEGVGMSPEIIDAVYRNLGRTTKENKPGQIGGYGIGKFSVFSYTETYYVDTISDGLLYNYIVGKDLNGMPDINDPTPIPTTECNGTTVWFDLKFPGDFHKFREGVMLQLKYFRTIITKGFDLENDYDVYQGEHFVYRPDRTNVDGLEICWGNIYYPINWVALGMTKINLNCAIYFPTETPLQPTLSREALETKPHVLTLIKDKIELARQELTARWKEQQVKTDFFDWLNATEKVIKFPKGTSLNVTNLIKEQYLYAPIIGTHINPNKLRNNANVFLRYVFEYTKRHGGPEAKDIIGDADAYYTEQRISTYKLSRVQYSACIRRKLPLVNDYSTQEIIKCCYPVEYLHGEEYSRLYGPQPITYRTELPRLVEEIWKSIKRSVKCLDQVTLQHSKRNVTFALNDEVRGKFRGSSEMETWTLEEVNDYNTIVYCHELPEYRIIDKIKIPNFGYLCILTTKKYSERLKEIGAISYEELLNSELLALLYQRTIRKTFAKQLNMQYADPMFRIHAMYKFKYRATRDYYTYGSKKSVMLPEALMDDFAQKYPLVYKQARAEFMHHFKVLQRIHDEYVLVDKNNTALKYKILYQNARKKCIALDKQTTPLLL